MEQITFRTEDGLTLEGELRVRVHSLDGLARQGTLGLDLARLVFVKVDCEGSEPLVLAGMRETLRATSPAIMIGRPLINPLPQITASGLPLLACSLLSRSA